MINYNEIKLTPATLQDYPAMQNMARFYAYDMSEYLGNEPGWEMPENGLYECIDFKKYWETADTFPFFIRYGNELAGFAIVDKKGSAPDIDFNMAQFFILRKFQHKGLGRYVAQQLFDKFQGTWEAMVLPGNEGSYRATRAAIQDYTKGEFTEYARNIAHFNNRQYNIFRFTSKKSA